MSVIGNIIWLIFGGFIAGLGYIIGGLLLCLTIIGIPFGLKAIRVGMATLTPFGKAVIPDERGEGCLPLMLNIIWIVLFGWEIALAHLVSAGILAITIIGIPFGLQSFKMAKLSLLPFGARVN